ncbi:MAG TPA: DsrE family protein [Candidatus Dormibacteraeota bacterium]|nr:DsrE family protein [Candidatus Dormibacteraeota bacterium]
MMLASDRDAAVVEAASSLCRAAAAAGHRSRLFLLGDATRLADAGARLAADGVEVSLCEADAAMRGIHKSVQPRVFFGSLYDWATLVEDADRVMSLT